MSGAGARKNDIASYMIPCVEKYSWSEEKGKQFKLLDEKQAAGEAVRKENREREKGERGEKKKKSDRDRKRKSRGLAQAVLLLASLHAGDSP
jgi:hypothetical protein